MRTPSPPRPTRKAIWIHLGLWAFIALVLVIFHRVLLPFGGAILIAYLAAPLVDRLAAVGEGKLRMPRGVSRGLSVVAIYAAFLLLVYGFSVLALPQLYRESARLTAEARELTAQLTPQRVAELSRAAEQWLSSHGIPVSLADEGDLDTTAAAPEAAGLAAGADESLGGAKLQLDLDRMLRQGIAGASEWLRTHIVELVNLSQKLVAKLLGGVFIFFFMLMVAAFVLVDTESILRFVRSLAPAAWRPSFDSLLESIDEKLSGVVRGQIVICLVNGVLTLIGLLIFQVKFAFVLATIATVLSFIPIFGTVISTIPIVLVGLTQSFSTAVAALLWILGIHAVEAYLLNPKIMGSAAKIHPALVAFSILAGERTFGFVGALFAVPVASIVIATFEHLRRQAEGPREVEPAGASEAEALATEG